MRPLLSTFIRKRRIQEALPYIKGNVLDLGCGFTKIPPLLSPEQKYVGVDQNPKILVRASLAYPNHHFYKRNLETDEILFSEKYDTILLLAVLEHLENPHNILRQIPNLLKQNGNLLISTPSPLGGKIHIIGSFLGLFSKTACGDHKIFYRMQDITQYVEQYGLKENYKRHFLLRGNQFLVFQNASHLTVLGHE